MPGLYLHNEESGGSIMARNPAPSTPWEKLPREQRSAVLRRFAWRIVTDKVDVARHVRPLIRRNADSQP